MECFNIVGGEILTFPDTLTTQGLSLWCFNIVLPQRDPDPDADGTRSGGDEETARPCGSGRSTDRSERGAKHPVLTCVSHCDHGAYSGSARAPLGSAAAAPGKTRLRRERDAPNN